MTEEDEVYFCEECKKTKDGSEDGPLCCGKAMKKLPLSQCTKAGADAEHARFTDDDDACDDGRGA